MKPKGAEPSPDLHAVDPRKVDILLIGYSRDRSFDALEYPLSPEADELPQVWATHPTALLREAERVGIARPCWAELHYEDTPEGEGAA